MTFTLQDLKHLEIMAELEERPASPSEESTVVEAVHTLTLTEKLLTLASKLRTAGFVQQAENLETTFGMYKKAEQDANLLYRAHSETGDDLLEFAHPDGDVEMAPAQDHNGDVETLQSKHKKIVDVVQKTAQLNGTIKNIIIAQKFQTLLDTISKNYLSSDGNDVLRDKKIQNFVAYVSNIYDMAERVVQAFNNAGETQRITAFATIKTIINAPSFRIDSIEDIDSFIDTTLKTLEAGSPFKKASIIGMLRESLGVKVAQVPVNTVDLDKRKKSYNEFESIVKEIIATLETPLNNLFNNIKYEVMLDSGKPMIKWKEEINISMERLKNSVNQYKNYVENNVVNDKSAATIWPKDFLDKVNTLAVDMQKSINTEKNFKIQDPNSKEKGLDNVKFPNILKSKVIALQHLWFTFWAKYGEGKEEDLEYHSKFLTPNRIIQIFTPEKQKLESVKSYIIRVFSQSNEIKSTPALMSYINSMTGFIDNMEKNFQVIIDKAQAFVNGDQGSFGTTDEMTMETIKNFITDKTLLSKANFTSPREFSISLDDICKTLFIKLHTLVNSNDVFNKNKSEIIESLNDRSSTLFGPK